MRETPDTCIETYTGRYYDYVNPTPRMICVEDIAAALANTCRFAGHVARYYSVAQHAVLVALRLEENGETPAVVFAGLHHDSHEAYIGDLPSPLKRLVGDQYRVLTTSADEAIGQKFGINPAMFKVKAIVEADAELLFVEAGVLKRSRGKGKHWGKHPAPTWAMVPWSREQAGAQFLQAHLSYAQAAKRLGRRR